MNSKMMIVFGFLAIGLGVFLYMYGQSVYDDVPSYYRSEAVVKQLSQFKIFSYISGGIGGIFLLAGLVTSQKK